MKSENNENNLGVSISRAGKQQQACWNSEERLEEMLRSELDGFGKPAYDYQQVQAAIRGHARGWIVGVSWCKRNWKPKRKSKGKK